MHHLESKYLIIDNISLSYNLVENYVSPILQKEAIDIAVKGLIMIKIQSLDVKEAPYICCWNFYYFFTAKVDFEKK
jgi:hypothetical protein